MILMTNQAKYPNTGRSYINCVRKANQNQPMYMHQIIHLILFFFIFLTNSIVINAQKVNTIVLDAGHGGHDSGAIGKNSREKDITLDIALNVSDLLRKNLKDVKIILTREGDYFVELYKRAKIANENKADLFISIHCNSVKSPNASGAETFVMGLHKSDANLAVAMKENEAILLEDNYVEQYDGFDPSSPEGMIFFSMMQSAFLDNSLALAGNVQDNMTKRLGLFNRGVKQAGFLVLYKTTMPGVLIEIGFVSNPNDEKYLLSQSGQAEISQAIADAIIKYKTDLERNSDFGGNTNGMQDTGFNSMKTDSLPNIKVLNNTSNEMNVDFRVQFATFPDKQNIRKGSFTKIEDVREYKHSGQYKYTSGSFSGFDQANEHRKKMSQLGYKDAFVVAFKNNERITIEEARKLIEK